MNKLIAGLLLVVGIVFAGGVHADVSARFNLVKYTVNGQVEATPPTPTFTATIQGSTISYRVGNNQVTGQFVKSWEDANAKWSIYENGDMLITVATFKSNGNVMMRQETISGNNKYAYVYQVVRSAQQPVPPAADPTGEGLIVKANNSAAAASCSAIMMAASSTGQLNIQENQKVLKASTSFLNMHMQAYKELSMNNDRRGMGIAQDAATTTNRRISALPQSQRNAEILSATNTCLSVL